MFKIFWGSTVAPAALAEIAVVQTKTSAMGDDASVTLDAPATDGNLLVVVGFGGGGAGSVLSVTDNSGVMTWNSLPRQVASGNLVQAQIFWGIAAGAPTVITLHSSGTMTTTLHMLEASGIRATPLDGASTGDSPTGSSQNVSPPITPTHSKVLLVGGVVSTNAATYTLPSGFTRIDVASSRSDAGWRIVSVRDAYDFATTSGTGEIAVSALAAFMAADVLEASEINAELNATLGALTVSSQAILEVQGQVSVTLGALTTESAAELQIAAALDKTFDALTLSSQATLEVQGQVSVTLGALSTTSAAELPIAAVLGGTFEPLILVATATLEEVEELEAVLDQLLGELTLAAAAQLEIQASLNVTLGALTTIFYPAEFKTRVLAENLRTRVRAEHLKTRVEAEDLRTLVLTN
jgi:hypothetical protein